MTGTNGTSSRGLSFNLVGTIADVDETTLHSPAHPAPVLLLEIADAIHRIIVPGSAGSGPRGVLEIGRRVRVGGSVDFPPKIGALPVAFHVEFVDVH